MAVQAALAGELLIPEVLRTENSDLGPNQQKLVATDRAVMLQLIKLARFNIRFHQEANRRWVWRSWLYPIAQETGTGASFANTIIDLNQRGRGLNNPKLISTSMQKQGLKSAIVGNAISGGASAAELAQNAMVVFLAHRQGFSPRDSVNFVKGQLSVIDELLAQRQQIVSVARPGPIHQTYELEGRLLQQTRDQLLLEFKRWSAHSRETMWRENTFYAIDSLQNFTLLSGSVISTRAFATPSLRGSAAICALVANSAAALNPPVRTAVGLYVRHYQRWHLSRVFPDKRPGPTQDLLADWGDLNQQAATSQSTTIDSLHIKEAAFLAENAERAEVGLAREQNRIEKLRQVAAQQAVSGPIIGMTSVARSLLATIGYYGYRSQPVVNNRLAFAGRISQACGQTYSLITTPATRIKQTVYTQHLRKQGQLPSQMLERRLKRLDELEKEIQESKTSAPTVDKNVDTRGTKDD